MNKVELLKKFKEFKKSFYTFAELQIILGLSKLSTNKRIIDLVSQGFLIKLGKNIYVPSFLDYNVLKIANDLKQPAYISFESALSFYHILESEENVITLATFLNFPHRDIGGKTIIWSRIKKELFFGFVKEKDLMIATPEKALADLIYVASFGRGLFNKNSIDLNKNKFDKHKFSNIIKYYPPQTQHYAVNVINSK